MLCVFVDTSQMPGAFKPSPAPNLSQFSGVLERLAKASHSYTATQPQIWCQQRVTTAKLLQARCAGPCLALLAGGLAFSTDARQSLELKRSARDRMVI
jgi:hypothetical protein